MGITIIVVLVERFTDIIEYKRWEWYATWLSLFATFYINKNFVALLFKRIEKEARLDDSPMHVGVNRIK